MGDQPLHSMPMRGLTHIEGFFSCALLRANAAAQTVAPSAAAITEAIEVFDKDALAAGVTSHNPNELYPYFSTVLYVSKAAEGVWVQKIFVFTCDAEGLFELSDSFSVSTGRERHE